MNFNRRWTIVKQNTRYKGALLSFLSEETHDDVLVNVEQDISLTSSGKQYANTQLSITISNIDGHVTDPMIIEEHGRRYKFTGVAQVGHDEAIAENMEVTDI